MPAAESRWSLLSVVPPPPARGEGGAAARRRLALADAGAPSRLLGAPLPRGASPLAGAKKCLSGASSRVPAGATPAAPAAHAGERDAGEGRPHHRATACRPRLPTPGGEFRVTGPLPPVRRGQSDAMARWRARVRASLRIQRADQCGIATRRLASLSGPMHDQIQTTSNPRLNPISCGVGEPLL